MTPKDAARELELVARDLDLVVFRLERDPPGGVEGARDERGRVRRELEVLRERIEALARALDSIRRGSTAVILPLVAFLFGLGYYGTRSVLWMRALDAGVDSSDLQSAMLLASGAGVAGAVLAAALGALVGPSAVAAGGLVVAGCACLITPTSAVGLFATTATLGFGAGMYRPGLYAAAGRPWKIGEGAGIALVLVLAWVGLNGAAVAASPVAGWLHGRLPAAVGPVCALVSFVAAALAAADAGVQQLAPRAEPETPWDPRAVGVAAAIAVAVAGLQGLWTAGSNAQYDAIGPALQASAWTNWLNPVAVIVTGLLVAAVLAVAAAIGARVPVLLAAGAGFAALGVTFVASEPLGWLPPGTAPVTALVAAAVVVGGAAEVAALPLALAAASRGVHWRASTAVLAIPFAAVGLITAIISALPTFPFVGVACGLALLIGGLAMAAAAIPLDRWLLAPDDIGREGAGS